MNARGRLKAEKYDKIVNDKLFYSHSLLKPWIYLTIAFCCADHKGKNFPAQHLCQFKVADIFVSADAFGNPRLRSCVQINGPVSNKMSSFLEINLVMGLERD